MQDFRYVGLDILTQAANTRRYSFLFLSQLAYNSEILSKFAPYFIKDTDIFETTKRYARLAIGNVRNLCSTQGKCGGSRV